jgi:hypothetical protein
VSQPGEAYSQVQLAALLDCHPLGYRLRRSRPKLKIGAYLELIPIRKGITVPVEYLEATNPNRVGEARKWFGKPRSDNRRARTEGSGH